jgi:hypothetical protein
MLMLDALTRGTRHWARCTRGNTSSGRGIVGESQPHPRNHLGGPGKGNVQRPGLAKERGEPCSCRFDAAMLSGN